MKCDWANPSTIRWTISPGRIPGIVAKGAGWTPPVVPRVARTTSNLQGPIQRPTARARSASTGQRESRAKCTCYAHSIHETDSVWQKSDTLSTRPGQRFHAPELSLQTTLANIMADACTARSPVNVRFPKLTLQARYCPVLPLMMLLSNIQLERRQ